MSARDETGSKMPRLGPIFVRPEEPHVAGDRRDGAAPWRRAAAVALCFGVIAPTAARSADDDLPPGAQGSPVLAASMACLTRHLKGIVPRGYFPAFRVHTDADGYLLGAPILLNPLDDNAGAAALVDAGRTALTDCQPLPVRTSSDRQKASYSRVIRFDPAHKASGKDDVGRMPTDRPTSAEEHDKAADIASASHRKVDIRGLTLGMSKADALARIEHELGAACVDPEGEGLTYACNTGSPPATYQAVFTAATPHILRSLNYSFVTTHDRQTVIADVSRSYEPPVPQKEWIAWATWSLGGTTRLHLTGGGDDIYTLVLEDATVAQRDFEQTQRSRNEAPSPRF